jgi:hypothetical protein
VGNTRFVRAYFIPKGTSAPIHLFGITIKMRSVGTKVEITEVMYRTAEPSKFHFDVPSADLPEAEID